MLCNVVAIPCQQLFHALDEAARHVLAQIDTAFRHFPWSPIPSMGVRRIHQGARGRNASLFPRCKSNGAIPLERKLELAYAAVPERSPAVLRYRTQMTHILLPAGNRRSAIFWLSW